MGFSPFLSRPCISSTYLPLTLMTLEDWTLINISGKDSEKYLQSQVTIDVTQITMDQHVLAAHCNPKGKVWSNLRIFRHGKGFFFIERRSVCELQISELKKYAVFSEVVINHVDNFIMLGVAGCQARTVLKELFRELPNKKKILTYNETTWILWFKYPIERFLIITDEETAKRITIAFRKGKANFNNSRQWLALHIEAGIPIIDLPNSGKFIPQAINLDTLGSISFKKGCYTGQETVARARFRGKNKYSLYFLSGITERNPEIGEKLEVSLNQKKNEHWCIVGTILAAVHLINGCLLVQAVINNNINTELNRVFRINNDLNKLKITPLPYS